MAIDFPASPTSGQTLQSGNQVWTFDGAVWKSGFTSSGYVQQLFTATAGQTSFTVTGGYAPNLVNVFKNGTKLVNGTNVTVSSGTSVVLTVGATAGDIIEVIGWAQISLAFPISIANGGTGATSAGAADTNLRGFTSTATAGGTTTLTASSTLYQIFTGTANQTITLPDVTTLLQGWSYHLVNNSTGTLTVNSSDGNAVIVIPAGTTAMATCILVTGTTAASWEAGITDFSSYTGSGSVVMSASPTFTGTVNGDAATFTGNLTGNVVFDAIGDVRTVPQNAKTGAYALLATDVGKHISITTGGVTVGSGVFSIGDVVTIYNNSTASQTITSSGVTMYLAGTATTGNRTLAQRGLCTILCVASNVFVISGGGLT